MTWAATWDFARDEPGGPLWLALVVDGVHVERAIFDAAAVLANADAWWRSCAELALVYLARCGAPFSADDLTDLGVPDPDHPNRWGALFRAACSRGEIVPVGFTVSRRPSRRGGVVRVWAGVGSEAVAA